MILLSAPARLLKKYSTLKDKDPPSIQSRTSSVASPGMSDSDNKFRSLLLALQLRLSSHLPKLETHSLGTRKTGSSLLLCALDS